MNTKVAASIVLTLYFVVPARGAVTCLTSKCHADLARGKSVHGPVKAKGCTICHAPGDEKGAGKRGAKLPESHPPVSITGVAATTESCLACHDDLKDVATAGRNTHEPLRNKGCTECHDPHRSEKHSKLLKVAPGAVGCLSCHDKIRETMASAKHKHAPIFEKESCTGCHNPHGSANSMLLKTSATETCLKCHEKPVKAADGRELVGLRGWRDKTRAHHGSTAKTAPQCVDCHAVHGSHERALLKASYTHSFHAPFDPRNFELCFRCHTAELATRADADKQTAFRNGEHNLHQAHLSGKKRARTCRACHEVHFASGPKLVPEWVGYKDLLLPLRFRKTPSGGNCTTACHGHMSYDREHRVNNAKQQ